MNAIFNKFQKSVYLNYFMEHSCTQNVKEAAMRQESQQFKSPDEHLTPSYPSETAQSPTVEGYGCTEQFPGEHVIA